MPDIFADHCVHTDLVDTLRSHGFTVIRAYDVSLASATDTAIFSYTVKHHLILLTFDKGFGNPLVFDLKKSEGVVIVVIEKMSQDTIIRETLKFFQQTTGEKLPGNVFVIEPARVRVSSRRIKTTH